MVRLVLGCCELVLVAVSGALFAFVAYTGETLRFVGADAGIAGTAWGYTQVTAWPARRAANNFILSLVIAGNTMRTLPVAIFSFVSYVSLNWGGLTAAPPSLRCPCS